MVLYAVTFADGTCYTNVPLNLRSLLITVALLVLLAGSLLYFVAPSPKAGQRVVVYTSVDREYAEEVFKKFTDETGITVEARYDSEAAKSREMLGRLLQMKDKPDGDVCWNSELSLTQVLANADALQPYDSPSAKDVPDLYKERKHLWTGFGCRARVIIFNTNLIKRDDVPKTLDGLADPRWKGKVCVPRPAAGTTLSHFASIFEELGEEKALKLFRGWRENQVTLVESNSDSREQVSNGNFAFGLTDTDDALEAVERKKPVDFLVADQSGDWHGAYLVPNTVSILKNCAHLTEAKKFVDFLLRPETEAWLAEHGAHQIPVREIPNVKTPIDLRGLKPAHFDAARLGQEVRRLGDRIVDILEGKEK
jgi:iron(III) transport system substrate-binding protein